VYEKLKTDAKELEKKYLKLKNEEVEIIDIVYAKKQYLKKEMEVLEALENDDKKYNPFQPQRLTEIVGASYELVGLDYVPMLKGAYNVLTGRGGSGKTAVAFRSMIKYLKLNPKEKGLAFFSEDNRVEIEKRINIICSDEKIDKEDILNRIDFVTVETDKKVRLVTKTKNGVIANMIETANIINYCIDKNIKYIILDPLKRFHSVNENDNSEIDILVRDVFIEIATKTGAVLVVIHHSAKGIGSETMSRGASTITDSARLGWNVGRIFKKDKHTGAIIFDEEMKSRVMLTCIKDNQGAEEFLRIRKDGTIPHPLFKAIPNVTITKFKDEPEINTDENLTDFF